MQSKVDDLRNSTIRYGVTLCLILTGCAAGYSGFMAGSLNSLGNRDYARALERLEEPKGKTNRLLYQLERGLILHYQGEYESSNQEFEAAERLIDQLYARSVSREIASLVTNDAIRPYSGEEFERSLIHFYRAMNYEYLGQRQEALVECRKANLRLEDYAAAADYELSYKNDAFLQYMAGLFFEAEGELNDAYISYKDAEQGYRAYQEAFGIRVPTMVISDLIRLAAKMGYTEDVTEYLDRYGRHSLDLEPRSGGEVVVFVETGFVPRKRQQEINIPILEQDNTGDVWGLSDRMVHRHRQLGYKSRRRYNRVEYWLKLAMPYYEKISTKIGNVRLRGNGQVAQGVLVEDLNAIALRSLQEKQDVILLRTIARGIAKYVLSEKAEKENKILGFLVNMLGVSTEAADTRGWLSLPAKIQVARFSQPPGTVDLVVEFLSGRGQVVETAHFPQITVEEGKAVFLSYRSYK